MRRGTTPAITLTVDADITAYTVYVTLNNYKQQVTIEGERLNMEYQNSKTTIVFALTQEETLAFGTGTCEVQVRAIHDGTAIATDIRTIDVRRILKEGVIDE